MNLIQEEHRDKLNYAEENINSMDKKHHHLKDVNILSKSSRVQPISTIKVICEKL